MNYAAKNATGSGGEGEKRHLRFKQQSSLSSRQSTQAKIRDSVGIVMTAESVSMAQNQTHERPPVLDYVEYKPTGGVVDRSKIVSGLAMSHKLSTVSDETTG